MPIYEYVCNDCDAKFQKLRPMREADAPAPCASCGSAATSRALSLFAAVSRGSNGETQRVSGTGSGCATCASRNCATCSN